MLYAISTFYHLWRFYSFVGLLKSSGKFSWTRNHISWRYCKSEELLLSIQALSPTKRNYKGKKQSGTLLVVQWLILCTPNVGGTCLITNRGTKIQHATGQKKGKKKQKKILLSKSEARGEKKSELLNLPPSSNFKYKYSIKFWFIYCSKIFWYYDLKVTCAPIYLLFREPVCFHSFSHLQICIRQLSSFLTATNYKQIPW